MERFDWTLPGRAEAPAARRPFALVGVVGSGNLEVLVAPADLDGGCRFEVVTAAEGFQDTWRQVLADFVARTGAGNIHVAINDNAASPSVVGLRLDQALETLTTEDRP